MALKPPVEVPQGAIRLNTDSQKLEFFAQDQWWEMATDPTAPLGGGRGCFCGGSPQVNIIDYVTIATAGNAIDFGDTQETPLNPSAAADSTRGLIVGGYSPAVTNTISYITLSTTGNAADFGDMPVVISYAGGVNSSTRAVFGGSWTPGAFQNYINYVTIQSTGNGAECGD